MIKKSSIIFLGLMSILLLISLNFILAGDDSPSTPSPTCASNAAYCTTSTDCVAKGYKWAGLSINQEGACTDPNNNCCIPYGTIECGTTLSQSIALTGDVVCSGQTNGIVIGANNIKINCQGNSIGGTISGAGISLNGRSNVVIQNCKISPSTGTSKGLSVYSSSNIILEDISLNVASYLIHFHTTTNSIVDRIRAVSCTGTLPIKIAFMLEGSSGNTIKNSEMSSCTRGLAISDGSDNNIIKSNSFNTQLGGFSLYLYNSGSSNNWAKNNVIYNNIIRGDYQIIPANQYNTTYDCSVPNIVGGKCVGGNYWEKGYTGPDIDGDGVRDVSFSPLSGVIDSLPILPCKRECFREGMKECDGTGAYKTCGNYDSDVCLEWSSPVNCPSNTCVNGECNYNPNAIGAIRIKACCGSSALSQYDTSEINVCVVPLPEQENNCLNVHRNGVLQSFWIFPEEVKNSKPIILCDTGEIWKKRYELCNRETLDQCESDFSVSAFPNFNHCEIVGYHLSKDITKPASTLDYAICSKPAPSSSFISNPYETRSCQYNGGYLNYRGYTFLTEQSANNYGVLGIATGISGSCNDFTNRSYCLAVPANGCTWTPPGTTNVSDGGGCCGYQQRWNVIDQICTDTQNLCTNVFDPANPKLTISGLDPENDRYCAKITSGLSYGFWYPTEFY